MIKNYGSYAFTNKGTYYKDGLEHFELLGKGYSSHLTNIVNYYFDENNNGSKKCISIFKDKNTGKFKHEIYYYKTANSIQFYTSRCYHTETLPKKYNKIKERLAEIYNKIFI